MPYCTHCAEANIADAAFCKLCGARIGVPVINVSIVASAAPITAPAVATVTQAMAAQARKPLKAPLGAALLSWVIPGLGHLYVGRIGVGIALIVCVSLLDWTLLFIAAFTLNPLPLLAALIVTIKVAHSAANSARGINAARTSARAAVRTVRAAI